MGFLILSFFLQLSDKVSGKLQADWAPTQRGGANYSRNEYENCHWHGKRRRGESGSVHKDSSQGEGGMGTHRVNQEKQTDLPSTSPNMQDSGSATRLAKETNVNNKQSDHEQRGKRSGDYERRHGRSSSPGTKIIDPESTTSGCKEMRQRTPKRKDARHEGEEEVRPWAEGGTTKVECPLGSSPEI